jgi:hypothetical protein
MGHVHIHYSPPGSRIEDANPFARQIARMDELSPLIDVAGRLIDFQFVGLVDVFAMAARSQARDYHRLRVFDAICQTGRLLRVHLGYPDFRTGHVHTSWNSWDVWISLF